MGVGADLYMYDVVVKSSRSLSHLLMNKFLFVLIKAILKEFSRFSAGMICVN